MKPKRGMITMIVFIAVVVLLFVGYNIYRHPAAFRDLSDNSLSEAETESLRAEIAVMDNKDILVAYFSYSGTTKNVANALRERLGADLFEIRPSEEYSNVYMQSNREIRRNEKPALADTVENMDDYEIVFIGYPKIQYGFLSV